MEIMPSPNTYQQHSYNENNNFEIENILEGENEPIYGSISNDGEIGHAMPVKQMTRNKNSEQAQPVYKPKHRFNYNQQQKYFPGRVTPKIKFTPRSSFYPINQRHH